MRGPNALREHCDAPVLMLCNKGTRICLAAEGELCSAAAQASEQLAGEMGELKRELAQVGQALAAREVRRLIWAPLLACSSGMRHQTLGSPSLTLCVA